MIIHSLGTGTFTFLPFTIHFVFSIQRFAIIFCSGVYGVIASAIFCQPFTSPHSISPHAAHAVPPIAAHCAISHAVTSLPLSNIGCDAQNHAHTTPERKAILHTHFAHAKYPPPIGETASATSGNARPTLNHAESNSGFFVISCIAFTSSQNPAFHHVAKSTKSRIFPPYCNTFSVAHAPSISHWYNAFCPMFPFAYLSSKSAFAVSFCIFLPCASNESDSSADNPSLAICFSAVCSTGVSFNPLASCSLRFFTSQRASSSPSPSLFIALYAFFSSAKSVIAGFGAVGCGVGATYDEVLGACGCCWNHDIKSCTGLSHFGALRMLSKRFILFSKVTCIILPITCRNS